MQAEEEHVLVAETLIHLDICTVERADGDSAVHHELHAACAGGFLAGGGYLLGYLRCGYYGLGGGDAVVLDKVDLELILADGVVVDVVCHAQQQLDYTLCCPVARGGLCAEHEGTRQEFAVRVVMQLELEARDAHRTQQLALVLVQALDLNIHDRLGVEGKAVVAAGKLGKALLVRALYCQHAFAHCGVICVVGKLNEHLGVGEVLVTAGELLDESVKAGIYLRQPAAVIDAVGDVGEAFGSNGVEVVEEVVLENVAMQAGHAVDLLAGRKAEIRHVYLTVADDEVAAKRLAAAEVRAEILAPAAVDLAHDLPYTGQKLLDEVLRPLFKSLAHDGVVGVGDAVLDKLPCLVPAELVLVHEDTHELGDYHCRVSVVYLDDVVLGETADIAPCADVLAHDVLCGGGDEEVLLFETQELALGMIVRGIKHLRDDLGHGALLKAFDICALGEKVHVQRVRAHRVPKAQGVDLLRAVAGDEHIARQGDDGGVAGVLGVVVAEAVPARGYLTAETDLDLVLVAGDQPALSRCAPIVGDLGLTAVFKLLLEHAQLVADGVARGLETFGCHGVHEAGGETAEAAIAETRVRLLLEDIGRIAPHVLKCAGDGVGDAEVVGVLHKAAPHEELHRHIVYLFFRVARVLDGEQAAHKLADDYGRGLKYLLVGGVLAAYAELRAELILYRASDFVSGYLIVHLLPPWSRVYPIIYAPVTLPDIGEKQCGHRSHCFVCQSRKLCCKVKKQSSRGA